MSRTNAKLDDDDWTLTFAFWSALLLAGALFAVVALAPKLRTLAELDARFAENQFRLVELERQAQDLAKVTESLENDPAFAAQLAMLEFSAGRAGDERISVPQDLQLGTASTEAAPAATPRVSSPVVPRWLLEALATWQGLRLTLLAVAALVAVTALLALHESQAAIVRGALLRLRSGARMATTRYRRSS